MVLLGCPISPLSPPLLSVIDPVQKVITSGTRGNIAKGRASMYHTGRRSLRMSTGPGASALAGSAPLAGVRPRRLFKSLEPMEGSMPEEPDDWKKNLPIKAVQEVQYIIDQFDEASDGKIKVGVARSGRQVDYLYVKRHILVREEYLGRVLEILQPEEDR